MSYLDRTDPTRRTTAITGVIVVHAAIGYLLLTGLISTYVPHRSPPLLGPNITLPPEPTPTPTPSSSATPTRHDDIPFVPKPPMPSPNDGKVDVKETPDPGPSGDAIGRDPIPDPTPTVAPSPRFTPRAASPKNDPGRWALTDDYPARDLREGNEGTTSFRVVIGSNGKVSACEVVRSSGFPGLDVATCKAVSARARFSPATDENGHAVVGTYGNSVRWQLPR